jgi:hypothetical protein
VQHTHGADESCLIAATHGSRSSGAAQGTMSTTALSTLNGSDVGSSQVLAHLQQLENTHAYTQLLLLTTHTHVPHTG